MSIFGSRLDVPDDNAAPAEARDASERALTEAVRAGDHAAYEQLFRRYYPPLCAFLAAKTGSVEAARDLAHNIFARLWSERARLDIRGTVRGYLYAAARFEAISSRRRNAYAAGTMSLWQSTLQSPGTGAPPRDPSEQVQLSELRRGIRHAVDELPPRCREVVLLRWQHQLTHAEIAQTLGISVKTVENQITIGFRALRKALSTHAPDPR